MKNFLVALFILCSVNVFAVTKTWTGLGPNNLYGTGANWNGNTVPGTSDDLIIAYNAAGNYPFINTPRIAKSIKFKDAGVYIIIKANASLTIKDKVENTSGSPNIILPDGSSYGPLKIVHTTGSCYLIGDMFIPQIELSTQSGDIVLDNCDLVVSEWLKLTAGNLDINTGSLTTLADATLTAYIHQEVGTTISGNVTIQQYVYATNGSTAIKAYHSMSPPCQSQTVGSIEDDASTTWITVSPAAYYPYSGSIPDIQLYDESQVDVINSLPWHGYHNTALINLSDPLYTGTGYFVRIKPTNNIVDWTGTVNGPSNYAITLFRTNNSEFYDGSNLIGNPYPEPIDWNLYAYNSLDLSSYISIWKNNGTEYGGAYANYDVLTGTSVNGADEIAAGIIPIGQGFHVKLLSTASSNPYTLTITEDMRVGDNYAYFYKEKPVITNKIGLTITGNQIKDETVVILLEDGSTEFDERKDFEKMRNPEASLFTLKSSTGLAMNKMSYPEKEVEVPLALEVNQAGTYTFNLSQSAFTDDYSYFFEDKANQVLLPILENFSYSFQIEGNTYDRFSLRIANKSAGDIAMDVSGSYCYLDAKMLHVQLLDKTIEAGQITVTDLSGKTVFNNNVALNNGNAAIDVSMNASGIYLVHVKHAKGTEVNKIMLK